MFVSVVLGIIVFRKPAHPASHNKFLAVSLVIDNWCSYSERDIPILLSHLENWRLVWSYRIISAFPFMIQPRKQDSPQKRYCETKKTLKCLSQKRTYVSLGTCHHVQDVGINGTASFAIN